MERIILDNGGGIILQLGDWAHAYNGDEGRAALDIEAWLDGDTDTSTWDGHDDDAAACDPTAEELRNGGYNIVYLSPTDTAASLAAELVGTAGVAAARLARALRGGAGDANFQGNQIF